jgi:hypothetical protein
MVESWIFKKLSFQPPFREFSRIPPQGTSLSPAIIGGRNSEDSCVFYRPQEGEGCMKYLEPVPISFWTHSVELVLFVLDRP